MTYFSSDSLDISEIKVELVWKWRRHLFEQLHHSHHKHYSCALLSKWKTKDWLTSSYWKRKTASANRNIFHSYVSDIWTKWRWYEENMEGVIWTSLIFIFISLKTWYPVNVQAKLYKSYEMKRNYKPNNFVHFIWISLTNQTWSTVTVRQSSLLT